MKSRLIILALACAGCQSQASKDAEEREKLRGYVATMAEQCEHAKANVAMVANVQSMMRKREDTEGLRGFERTMCKEADKAKAELTRQGG